MIGAFKDRLKKIQQKRTSKSGSKIISPAKADDLSQTQPEPVSTPAKTLEVAPVVSLFPKSPPVTDIFLGSTAQHADINREEIPSPKFEGKTSGDSFGSEITTSLHSGDPFPSFKDDTRENITVEAVNPSDDDDDDEFPSIPPPPVPALPPPDIMDLTPPPSDPAPLDNATKIEKKPSFKTALAKRHSSIVQKEVWKQKSDVLEGAMSAPLPLFIQSKPKGTLQESNFNDSSESLSSLPDSPPPTLPDSPPPLLPDSPPPLLPDDSNEMADDVMELPQTEELGSGSEDKGDLSLDPSHSPSEVLNQNSSNLESRPLSLPDSTPPIPPDSPTLPPTLPDSTPHAIPEPFPPTLPDSAPPTMSESLPSTLLDSAPPTMPESLPESLPTYFPSTSVPEPPISPLPTLHADTERHSLSVSPSDYIKTSTPQSQSSNDIQSVSLILAATPPSTSLSFERPPSEGHSKSSAKSPQSTIGAKPESQNEAFDDLKSSSEPNIEPAFSKDPGVQLRKGKQFRPTEYRQSFPLTINTQDTVRVISTDSPPASPDLKFTRVSKKIWKSPKNPLDDFLFSASTGNVTENFTPIHDSARHPTGSMRSLQSNDSTLLDRSSFLKNNLPGGGAVLSPLVAMTSTPTQREVADLEGGIDPKVPPAVPVGWDTESPIEKEKEMKIKDPIKPRQLEAVLRVTDRAKHSPINSFILDSNLLDVSNTSNLILWPSLY